MLSIGDRLPAFSKKAVVSMTPGHEFGNISSEEHKKAGKYLVLFWYPKDFTFVCPTEIIEFDKYAKDFAANDAIVVGASTDSEFVHHAWREHHPQLKNLGIPLIADTSKSLAEDLGILQSDEKIAYRATFIVDPEGIIRFVSVYDLDVGRNVEEVLRTLKALRTGERTPCAWVPGQKTLGKG